MIDYAIVGGGRLARHFSHYFGLLKIPHTACVRDRLSEFNTHATGDNQQRLRDTVADAGRTTTLPTRWTETGWRL